jgi:hypothetical protein
VSFKKQNRLRDNMLKDEVDKSKQVFGLLNNSFVDIFMSFIYPNVVKQIQDTVRSNFEYAENRWRSPSEVTNAYEEELLYYLNGCKETRIKFIDTFNKILIGKIDKDLLPKIYSEVSEYYIKLFMQEMRKYISEDQDSKALILQISNRVQNDINYANKNISKDKCVQILESDIHSFVLKETLKVIESIFNEEKYQFKKYFLHYSNKYNATIQHFFLVGNESQIAFGALDDFALESISEAENVLRMLPDFSLNKTELINKFISLAAEKNRKIDYTPEDYIREHHERSRYFDEMAKALNEKGEQEFIRRKSCKISENDTGYSYEKTIR